MNNKRLTYLDLARGIGILLVVLGHLEYISESVRGFISAFHMPLFFVISGCLIALKNETNTDFKTLITKKAHGLLIPYLWFSLIYIPIDIMNVCIHHIDMNTFIFNITSSFIFSGVGVLWFLPALFIAEVSALLLIKKFIRPYIVIPVTVLLSILLYLSVYYFIPMTDPVLSNLFVYIISGLLRAILRGIIASVFVVAGYYSYTWILGRKTDFSLVQLIIGLALMLITVLLFRVNGCVDFHFLILKNIAVYFPLAISSSLGIILICKNMFSVKLLEFYGKNSLIIMATHVQCYIMYIAIKLSQICLQNHEGSLLLTILFIASIVIIVFLIETVVILITNRFFPFVLGKKEK